LVTQTDQKKQFVEEITDPTDDFSRWYNDVVRKAQLADYAPVRGCMVIRPYGYGIWENIQRLLDARIKATGHQNVQLPVLIPESLLEKEAEHVQGFAPEVAWVTHGGREALEERYAIRPTSEALFGYMYSRWVESYRDLPMLLNQWCNVMRWEKVTRLFLRTAEFLWQEGHTCHATAEDCQAEVLRMLEVYRAFAEEDLAIPVHPGLKSESEKFAGAEKTYTVEALMRDGKALQAGTSHNLGQHFAKVFDITYQDEQGKRQFVHQTSWGMTTRMIGAIIMTHGDEAGLRLPPRVAPIQAVIVPIWKDDAQKASVLEFVARVRATLGGAVRLHLDDREQYSPGWKFNEYEMRGVPLRIEVGPKDVAKESVMTVSRVGRKKEPVALSALPVRVPAMLEEIQASLFESALAFRRENTAAVSSREELERHFAAKRGFAAMPWNGDEGLEAEIKAATGATLRCMPLDTSSFAGVEHGTHGIAIFAKSY
jgi:prolyl-tRNA synthetase